jgi:anti-sigma factor RsiW
MLVCSDVTEMTTEYLDHALPLRKRAAMRWHLTICSFCRRHLQQVRATIGLLHNMPLPPVPLERESTLLAELHRVLPTTPDQSG